MLQVIGFIAHIDLYCLPMQELTKNRTIVVHNLEALLRQLLTHIQAWELGASSAHRMLIGIAGPPAAGKSTLLASLVGLLKHELGSARVVGIPMDGYHLDNALLDQMDARARKGAPHTFDAGGLLSLVQRLMDSDADIYAPEFDRASDMSRNCAIKIEKAHDVLLIEGNYLLLDQPIWRDIHRCLNLSITIDIPDELIESRLIQRWLDNGYTYEDALTKAQANDLPNAATIRTESMAADIIYRPHNN